MRNVVYALAALGLIGVVHVYLPASFYTLTALLLVIAAYFAFRAVRGR